MTHAESLCFSARSTTASRRFGYPEHVTSGLETPTHRIFAAVNRVRSSGTWCGTQWHAPAPPLRWEARLAAAAQNHSESMATGGYFDHVDLAGQTPFMRMNALGYVFSVAAENISAGKSVPEEVVAWWLQSAGHCANLMNPTFVETGVGYATAWDAYVHYWTQTFGTLLSP